jgi:two-component system sensor histidine kinase/response regulator
MENYLLVVDDNIQNLQVVGLMLKKDEYKVAFAKSASEALQIIQSELPLLILLDVMMPDMDGYEFCMVLKQNSETAEIPIIFLTAKSEITDLVKGFECGGVDYVTKPFNEAELKARVNTHIALRKVQKALSLQAIELQKLNNTKNQIFSIISHDLRTPLASMNMLLNNMVDKMDQMTPEALFHNLILMEALTSETYQMMDNLLNWTRLQTNRLNPVAVFFNLNESVERAIRLYQKVSADKNISVHFKASGESIVFADEEMTFTIVRNFLNNALKFTPTNGQVNIVISKDNDLLTLSMSDSGIGISDETIQKIFSDVEYYSSMGTKGEKGTGVGLKLCRNFAQMNGGRIWATSKEGSGSVFNLILPCSKKFINP